MKYSVSILAQIGKVIRVEADDPEQAEELAHELFDPTSFSDSGYYAQDTYSIYEEEPDDAI